MKFFGLTLLFIILGYSAMATTVDTLKVGRREGNLKNLSIDTIVLLGYFTEQRVATPISVQSRNSVAEAVVVERYEIERDHKADVLSSLSKHVPGLFIGERSVAGYGIYSGSAGGITLRGVGGSPTTGVMVAVDGVPQMMGINGHHLPDAYRSYMVGSVEVLRGSSSTIYGSNAMGGVINIISREPLPGYKFEGEAAYGSYNTQSYRGSGYYSNGKTMVSAGLGHDRTSSHRPNSDFRITDAFVNISQKLSSIYNLKATYSVAKYISTDPGTIMAPSLTDTLTADVLRMSAALTLSSKRERAQGQLTAFYNYGSHKLYYGWNSTDSDFGLIGNENMQLFKGNNLMIGGELRGYGGHATDKSKPQFNLDKTLWQGALYAVMQQRIVGGLSANAGLRYEYNSKFNGEWVPQFALNYVANMHHKIGISASKGYRNPSIRELYVFAPNDSLQPERAMTYQLTYGYNTLNRRLSASLTPFIVKGTNIIETQIVGGVPRKSFNSGSYTNYGVEAALNYSTKLNLDFYVNYSYNHISKAIVGAPRHGLNGGVSYNYKRVGVSLDVRYIEGIYTSVGKVLAQDSFVLLDGKLWLNVAKWCEIYVKGNNLLNQDYQLTYGYPMPKANYLVGVKINL